MNIVSSYKIRIKHYNNIFKDTLDIYRKAVSFFIDVCDKEWNSLSPLIQLDKQRLMETLTHKTNKRNNVKYDFDALFYKFPSYLRRSAINEATGAYSSYRSALKNWDGISKKPKLQLDRNIFPVFYKGNMFIKLTRNTARIKIYHKKDWVWLDITLKDQDVKYIERYCSSSKELAPTILGKGKKYYLVFPYEDEITLNNKFIEDQVICAVDLGINNNATCSIMKSDGTVLARKFINLTKEKDHLYKSVGRVKKAQQQGARILKHKWRQVNYINTDISRKTAKGIVEFAMSYNVDVIVMEHLDFSGKIKGGTKQKLHLWRKKEIQRIVEHKAHKNKMRIATICAWGTSKLAYDGSGVVSRGTYIINGKECHNYSICTFKNGKQYNCDLNASYNIGARYFIRELLKSDLVISQLPSDVYHRYGTGSTRTLSTLYKLSEDLQASACNIPQQVVCS